MTLLLTEYILVDAGYTIDLTDLPLRAWVDRASVAGEVHAERKRREDAEAAKMRSKTRSR